MVLKEMYSKSAYNKSLQYLIPRCVFPKPPHFTVGYHELAESESLLSRILPI